MKPLTDLNGQGAAYVRVSQDTQDAQRQKESISQFCSENEVAIEPKWWFVDEGFYRDDESRPSFRRLLDLAKEKTVKWIVLDATERFDMKSPKRWIGLLGELEEWGCKLYAVDGQEWTETEISNDMTALFRGHASQKEGVDRSWRVLGKQALLAKEGIYGGGLPHFGLDVATYPSKFDMTELWRVVWQPELGPHMRLKVFPDGTTERSDKRGNMPPIAVDQVRRFVPSNDEQKLALVREVFRRFAQERISFNALAGLLNEHGYLAGGGASFSGTHIKSMLSQPAYIGRPAWNRRHVGKFHGWSNNRQTRKKKPQTKNGRKKFEPNDRADWIISEVELYPPIVDVEIWEAVQEKLQTRQPKERQSRNPEIILSGLLYCGHCGKPMSGGTRKLRDGSKQIEFYCGTYQKAVSGGIKEACSCKRHTLKQDDILGHLTTYVSEVAEQLGVVGDANQKRSISLLLPCINRLFESLVEERTVLCQMYSLVAYELDDRTDQEKVMELMLAKLVRNPIGFREWLYGYYREVFELDNEEHFQLKAELEAELEQLLERHRALPPDAARSQKRLNEEILEVERRLDHIAGMTENAADQYDRVDQELADHWKSLEQAQCAFDSSLVDGKLRSQSEALNQLLKNVTAFFRPVGEDEPRGTGQTRSRASKLERLIIVPKLGEEQEIELGDKSSTDSHAHSHDTD